MRDKHSKEHVRQVRLPELTNAVAVAIPLRRELENSRWPVWGAGRAAAVLAAIGLAVFAGCGSRSDRLEINGSVTLDGAPLDGGSIRFTSLGPKQMASGATVQEGEFRIPQENGLAPGTYHVQISAPDLQAPPVMVAVGPGQSIPTQPERIPPQYNVDSKETVEVSADGENHFVFDIVSRP
jgi:hypothetical protein